MARGAREIIQGTVVLDSQGLSLLLEEDTRMIKRIAKAREESFQVVISAITILESPGSGSGPTSARLRPVSAAYRAGNP